MPHEYKPAWGDTLLVAGRDPEAYYAIGVLESRAVAPQRTLVLRNGARAEVTGPPEAEKIGVFSRQGNLIFEYDPESGQSRVDIPDGDLEIRSRGHIAFSSEKGIRFCGREPIEMESPAGIGLTAGRDAGMTLKPDRVDLSGPAVGIRARRGDIQIEEANYLGRRFSGKVDHIRMVMERFETLAGNVIHKAKNVYRTVERLTQLRTGRLRTLVDETCQLKSKNAFVKTDEDFKVRADQIYLG